MKQIWGVRMGADVMDDYQIGDTILFARAAKLVVAKIAPDEARLDALTLVCVPVQGWRASPAMSLTGVPYPDVSYWLQCYSGLAEQSVVLIDLGKKKPPFLGETDVGLSYEMREALRETFSIGKRQKNFAGSFVRPINGQMLTLAGFEPDVLISFVSKPTGVYQLPTVSQLMQTKAQQRRRMMGSRLMPRVGQA